MVAAQNDKFDGEDCFSLKFLVLISFPVNLIVKSVFVNLNRLD